MTTESCCGKATLVVAEPIIEIQKPTEIEFLKNKETNAAARLEVCRGCEHLTGILNNCKLCGCFMNIKVRIYSAKCPADKW